MKLSLSSVVALAMMIAPSTASHAHGASAFRHLVSLPERSRVLQQDPMSPQDACENFFRNGNAFIQIFSSPYYFEDMCTCHDSLDSIPGASSVEVSAVETEADSNSGSNAEEKEGIYTFCRKPDYFFCDTELENCATKEFQAHFGMDGLVTSRTFTFRFIEGIQDTLVLQVDGIEDYEENSINIEGLSCAASINGNACQTCEVITCSGDEYVPKFNIACGDGVSVNQCATGTAYLGEGVLGVLNQHEYQQPLRADATPKSMCEEIKENYGEQQSCKCEATNDGTGDYMLMCDMDDCTICDKDEEVCGRQISGVRVTKYGKVFCEMSGFRYTKGRTGTSTVEFMFDRLTGEPTCIASTDGERCDSCKVLGWSDTCSNVLLFKPVEVQCPDQVNTCTATDDDGPFQFLVGDKFSGENGCYHEMPNVTETIRSTAALESDAEEKSGAGRFALAAGVIAAAFFAMM